MGQSEQQETFNPSSTTVSPGLRDRSAVTWNTEACCSSAALRHTEGKFAHPQNRFAVVTPGAAAESQRRGTGMPRQGEIWHRWFWGGLPPYNRHLLHSSGPLCPSSSTGQNPPLQTPGFTHQTKFVAWANLTCFLAQIRFKSFLRSFFIF